MGGYVSTGGSSLSGVGGGWAYWKDTAHTQASPQTILADSSTHFTVNGLDASTNTDYLSSVPTTIFDSSTINPESIGDSYSVRLDFRASRSSVAQNEKLKVSLAIGPSYNIEILSDQFELSKGSGETQKFSFYTSIFCLDTFVADGGRFFLTPTEDVTVWSKAIFIRRDFKG